MAVTVPAHHKEFVTHLRALVPDHFRATSYRDDYGKRPVMIGEFGPASHRLYSTIGVCDQTLRIPPGRFELATIGKLSWLPNALVSSVYWLKDRSVDEWPMVCEDVVRCNSRSTYRHMAYVPSGHSHGVSSGAPVSWLLGLPISDADIGISFIEASERVAAVFPAWLVKHDS